MNVATRTNDEIPMWADRSGATVGDLCRRGWAVAQFWRDPPPFCGLNCGLNPRPAHPAQRIFSSTKGSTRIGSPTETQRCSGSDRQYMPGSSLNAIQGDHVRTALDEDEGDEFEFGDGQPTVGGDI